MTKGSDNFPVQRRNTLLFILIINMTYDYKLPKCRTVGFSHDAMSSHIQLLTAGEEGWQNKELSCGCYRVEGGGGDGGMMKEEEEGELRVVVHCGSAAPAALLLCCLAQPSSLAGSQSQRREAVPHQFSVSERRGEGGGKGGRRYKDVRKTNMEHGENKKWEGEVLHP